MSVVAGYDGGKGSQSDSGGGSARLQHCAQSPSSSSRTKDARYQQQLLQQRHHAGSMLKQPSHSEPADVVRRALDFKCQGTQCYKEKKYREAIGKYHRALLEIKGLCRVLGDPDSSSKPLSSLPLSIAKSTTLTDEQKGAMENAELECYNSLAGETHTHTQIHTQLVSFHNCGNTPDSWMIHKEYESLSDLPRCPTHFLLISSSYLFIYFCDQFCLYISDWKAGGTHK